MHARITKPGFLEQAALILCAPMLLGLALGWFRAGSIVRDLPLLRAVLFWLCIWLGYWAVAGGFTLVLERVCAPLRRRPWMLLLLGGLCASAASAFYLGPYLDIFASWIPEAQRLRVAEAESLPTLVRLQSAMLNSSFGVVVWVAVNLYALRVGRAAAPAAVEAPREVEPRAEVERWAEVQARAGAGVAVGDAAAEGRLAQLIAEHGTLDDIVALQAQDHYVMVHLTQGKRLILHRFRDAVAELAHVDGAQVHRSWWISAAAARAAMRESGSQAFRLDRELVVPVGRTWRDQAQRLRAPR